MVNDNVNALHSYKNKKKPTLKPIKNKTTQKT